MQWKYKKEVPIAALLQNLQMVGLSSADLKCTVDLLYQKEANKLMWECETREGEPQIGTAAQFI